MKTFTTNFLLFLCSVLCMRHSVHAQTFGSISFGGITRNYIVKTPTVFMPGQQRPLVFNLHGYSSNASQQQFYCAMNAVADTAGFIVCYPDGINNAWNSGWTGVYGSGIDDVGFISALIDTLHTLYNIDLSRVYACGMSNGGFQSYRMACELENRICAFASVTGTFTDSVAFYCSPSRPVPIMEIHGTADNTVNYNGGAFYKGIEETIAFWVNHNQCLTTADTTDVPNTVLTDSTTAQIISYRNCAADAQVVLIKIQDGGHTWPGSPLDLSGLGYGFTSQDINASSAIWNFFNQFSLPSAVGINPVATEKTFHVGPNPFQEMLQLQVNETPDNLEIHYADGRLLWSARNVLPGNMAIHTGDWPAGMYFVKTMNSDQIQLKKLIKN